MEYKDITREKIEETFRELFRNQPLPKRSIKIYTNASGMDNFEEATEEMFGRRRIYIGRKPSRIVKNLRGKIFKSHNGRYFRYQKI